MSRSDEDHEYSLWREWMEDIWSDLTRLQASKNIWQGYTAIVQANPAIQSPGSFHSWVADSYGKMQAVAVRRQADTSPDVRTLGRLLKRIAGWPEVMSRERFLIAQGPDLRSHAERWFDELVGPGRDHIDRAAVQQDLVELKARAEPIKRYVNKRVAHHADEEFKEFPSYGDIHECLTYLWNLYRNYHNIVTGATMDDKVLMPAWEIIFRHPWDVRPPANPETAFQRAMEQVARMSPEMRTRLRGLLTAHSRVPSAVIGELFDEQGSRELARALMNLDGDEALRQAVIDLLGMWGTREESG